MAPRHRRVIHTVEKDRVHVRMEPEIRRRPLHDEHRSALAQDSVLLRDKFIRLIELRACQTAKNGRKEQSLAYQVSMRLKDRFVMRFIAVIAGGKFGIACGF